MNEYEIYSNRYNKDFSVSVACLDFFENIDFLHKSRSVYVGASYSKYCYPHKFSYLIISYTYVGETVYSINGKTYSVRQGEFMIYGRGCASIQTSAAGGSVIYSVSVNPQFCKKYGLCDDMICHIKSDDKLTNLFLSLIKEYDKDCTNDSTVTSAIQMLMHIDHHYKKYSAGTPDSGILTDKQMTKVIKYINRNLSNKIHLKDMANVVGLDHMYFCRIFKKTCGYSPIRYANFLRCRTARQILLTTDFAPNEIMEMCGFYSMTQFKKMYKNLTGRDALADAKTPAVVIEIK